MSKHRTEKDKFQEERKKYPRVNFEGFLFFEICREACNSVEQNRKKLKELHEKLMLLTVESLNCRIMIFKHEAIAITFAAMYLEACIWDYAACKRSQKYTKDYLEKLDFVSKWVVIPELICGSQITRTLINGKSLLSMLCKLRKTRNRLVHSKSKPAPEDEVEYVKAHFIEREITAEYSFNLIKLSLRELEKVDNTNWWFFQTAFYSCTV